MRRRSRRNSPALGVGCRAVSVGRRAVAGLAAADDDEEADGAAAEEAAAAAAAAPSPASCAVDPRTLVDYEAK